MKIDLRIENAFEFLKIQHNSLKNVKLTPEALSKISSVEELYALCLCSEIDMLNKRGLYKEYITHKDEELVSPRGMINVTKTITRQSKLRGRVVCSYSVLSDNVLHNQIIKTAINILLTYNSISKDILFKLKKANTYLNGIDIIEEKDINWRNIRYNNSNIRYKTSMWLCEVLIKSAKLNRSNGYTLEDRLYETFKNHLYQYYKELYNDEYIISKVNTDFDIYVSQFERDTNKNDSIIILENAKEALILKICLYDDRASAEKLDGQLKQLKIITLDYQLEYGKKSIGAIIYCNPNIKYTESELKIVNVDRKILAYDTIDLNTKYKFVDYKLKQIVNTLISIEKRLD